MYIHMPLTPFPFPVASEEIDLRRSQLLSDFQATYPELNECPIKRIPVGFLSALLHAYDHLYLKDSLSSLLPDLCVVAAPRMISCGGKFMVAYSGKRRARCEIRMGTDFLLRLTQGPFSLNGLSAQTPLEAFFIVFEHELCHALELALTGHCNAHGEVFRALSYGLFGHTDYRHSLPTRAAQAAASGVTRGVQVTFSHKGQTFKGIVARVGKTVTVMVPAASGSYYDKRGKRYRKYLVPPEAVKPLSFPSKVNRF